MRARYGWMLAIALGLALACSPPAEETDVAVETGLENGSFSANLNGFDIHYEVHGQGPVLMTVPNSWGLSLEGLRALYRPLEERLTMVYFDPRGMGESGPIKVEEDMGLAAVRQDFDALRRHLGLETTHAIGWSNGATNLIPLAAEYPDTLSSAIFLHGAASFGEEDMKVWSEKYPELLQRYTDFDKEMADESLSEEEKTARQRAFWLEESFPVLFADPESGKAKLEALFSDAEFSRAHADYANREAPTFDFRDKLPAITTRCLVIAGAHDMLAPEKVRELHEGLADSKFVLFDESGHFSPVEEPEKFETVVYEFLGVK
jgi:proline iminopeptidase